jgi:hypothetical protein
LTFQMHSVGFGHIVAGVGQPKGKVAIVGEQQRPGGIGVNPTHGVHADGVQVWGQNTEHGGSPLGIGTGRHHAQGFVQKQVVVGRALMGLERLLVHLDAIAVWIGPLAQVGYGAIHLNLPGFNQLLSLPSGGNPVLGKNFL